MRKHNNHCIIGVDAGYGNMKTARTIYPTGLVAMWTVSQLSDRKKKSPEVE